jgi:hypothetical protein
MEIFRGSISKNTIDVFRQHHQKYSADKSKNYVNQAGIDIRTLIQEGTDAFDEVKKICLKHFPLVENREIYANYQRQSKPTFMHVDEFGADRTEKTWTIIIPMHTDDRLNVVLLKNYFNTNEDLKKFVINFDYDNAVKKNNASTQVTIDHTPHNYKNPDQYLIDYMDLDGIFEYKLGDYVLFDTNQAHASSNFTTLKEYEHKDLVQIHIGKSPATGHDPYFTEK